MLTGQAGHGPQAWLGRNFLGGGLTPFFTTVQAQAYVVKVCVPPLLTQYTLIKLQSFGI